MSKPSTKKDTPSQTVRGAYCQLNDLVMLQHAAKSIKLASKHKQNTSQQGNQRSHFRNRGLEFEEVRLYQPGDDIRTIDWRVTARSGKAHTKLFREERERPLFILIDQRLSSFIGSRYCFKSVYTAHLAALIAWAGLHRNERVGGIVFNDNEHIEIRAQRSKKSVLRLLQETCQYNQALNKSFAIQHSISSSLNNAIKEVHNISHTGASIFIISDFNGFNDTSVQHLASIAKHNQLHCLHIADKIEEDLPSLVNAHVTNGIKKIRLNMADKQLQHTFKEDFTQHKEHIKKSLNNYKINYSCCYTHQSPLDFLYF